ncbi:MAG: NADPH-dependent 7-cyano-7-deazaguanine reductase QueF [Candidatus Omnitrophica bacterium]|nr:NADPH-dependent 7-cyano-7-deazaguanine reductase QueF [Candidatus Omnitrophota bacterium]
MSKVSSYEGRQKHIRSLKMPAIEVWENQYPDRDYVVDLTIGEFTCICPKTALPDFATIKVSYKPAKVCMELKSLKLYLIEYRNVGIFHEHLVNKLLDDFVKSCKPRWMKIEVLMNPRGGIATTATAQYPSRGKKK